MDLRLAYRIATMKPLLPHASILPPGADLTILQERLRVEAAMIERATHFVFDNVADFYAAHERQVWCMDDDIPNWAPPFESFFAEWREPTTWNIGGHPRLEQRQGQVGYLVLAANVDDRNRSDMDNWGRLVSRFCGYQQPVELNDDFRTAILSARWLLCCSLWVSSNGEPLCGSPQWLGANQFVVVSPSGRGLYWFSSGPTCEFIVAQGGPASLASPLHILGLGLSFCHCKNIVRNEEEIPAGISGRWRSREPVPRLKFYTLNIYPMREVLRREGRSEEVGIKRALHICRGHFATYTPDHPLFGKYVGTFWRPDHVRGSKEQGEVHKRYRLSENPES